MMGVWVCGCSAQGDALVPGSQALGCVHTTLYDCLAYNAHLLVIAAGVMVHANMQGYFACMGACMSACG